MGEEALDELKGVKLINSGYNGINETITVWYDAALINIAAMEKALKDAGTCLGTEKD